MTVVTFDPTSAKAAGWRTWLSAALGDRGIPPDPEPELQIPPRGEASMVRLSVGVRWQAEATECHARAEVHIPVRRMLGIRWSGWPAYLVGLRLLISLG